VSQNRIVTTTENFPVQPQHIDASKHLFNAFDNSETEISAGWIIRFLQARNQSWEPFTYEEINGFYAQKYQHGFRFNRLVEPEMVPPSLARAFAGYHDPRIPVGGGWLVKGDDGKYYVTVDFITRCFQSSPAAPQVTTAV
jgi:hypothetical protein